MSSHIELGSTVVPLFKTFEELQRDEHEIHDQFRKECADARAKYDADVTAIRARPQPSEKLDKAAASRDIEKAATHEEKLALIKKVAEREVAEMFAPIMHQLGLHKDESEALATLNAALKAAEIRRDERLIGHSALSKRSHKFATAHDRRNYGPGVDHVPPAS